MLSTAHMEHGLPLLADLDLGALTGAQDPAGLIEVLAKAGQSRVIRKLAAIQRATVAELLDAEMHPQKALAMEADSAARDYTENFQDALRFFVALGPSLAGLISSENLEGEDQVDQSQPGNSPSED